MPEGGRIRAGVRGRLTVIGTGIHQGHLTAEAVAAMKRAERLFFMGNDHYVKQINPAAEDLDAFRADGKPREWAYNDMVDRILVCVRNGENVCAAFYGHPGVAVSPGHTAIRRARLEGYQATMLPGVRWIVFFLIWESILPLKDFSSDEYRRSLDAPAQEIQPLRASDFDDDNLRKLRDRQGKSERGGFAGAQARIGLPPMA